MSPVLSAITRYRELGVAAAGSVVATVAAPRAGFSALEVALISGLVLLVLKRLDDIVRQQTAMYRIIGSERSVDERIERSASRVAARAQEVVSSLEGRVDSRLDDHEARLRDLEAQ